ncbi:MAG: TolC family protein [bacterium]
MKTSTSTIVTPWHIPSAVVAKVPAILLIGCLGFNLGGCHRPLDSAAMRDPGRFESIAATENTEAAPTPASLDTPALRERILTHHPAVQAAAAKVFAAAAEQNTARSLPNPELDGRYINTDTGGNVEAALLFPLPWSGRLGAAGKVADLDLALARTALRATRLAVLLELEKLLTELAWARHRLDLATELADRSQQYASLAGERRSASMADPLDVSLVLADAARDQRFLARTQETVPRLESRLAFLLGLDAATTDYVISPPELEHRPVPQDTLLALAGRHRDALRLARLVYQRAEWDAARISRSRIPDLAVGPAYIKEGETGNLGVAFSLPLPIFNRGGGEYRAALARRDAAHTALQVEKRALRSEIDLLNSRLGTVQIELEALTGEALSAVEEAFDLARARYNAGQIDVLRLLSAHRAFAELKLEIIDLYLEQHQTWLALEKAVGWPLVSKLDPRLWEVDP